MVPCPQYSPRTGPPQWLHNTRERSPGCTLSSRVRLLVLILPLLLACCAAPKAVPEAVPPPPDRANTFLPSTHGFKFVNHFEGSPLPAALRDPSSPLGAILGGPAGRNIPATFGLCGGMSLTAADHYLAGVPMPAVTSPPAPGTPLYEHLYQRQVESLGDSGVMALAFWTWMNLPDGMDDTDPEVAPQSAADLTMDELAGINARLCRGEVVPLGLVLVRSRSNTRAPKSRAGQLWNNHQVIAYACTQGTAYGYSLRIYDPNFPDDDNVTIRIDTPTGLTPHGFFRVTGQGRTTRVRGIFPMPYTPSRPFIQSQR